MNQLPAIAFTYYDTFESLRSYRKVNKKLLLVTLSFGLMSPVFLYHTAAATAQQRGSTHPVSMMISIICAGLFMSLMVMVRHSRDQDAIRRVGALIPDTPLASIHQARSALLSYLFGQPPTSFLATAESVRKCFEFTGVTGRPFSFRAEDLMRFVYNHEAKTRITSLLLAVATLIAGLTLFNPEIREVAWEIVLGTQPAWFAFWLTGVFLLTGFYCISALVFVSVRVACDLFSRRSSNAMELNPALIRYLIRELATYHAWPSPPLYTPRAWPYPLLPVCIPSAQQTSPEPQSRDVHYMNGM